MMGRKFAAFFGGAAPSACGSAWKKASRSCASATWPSIRRAACTSLMSGTWSRRGRARCSLRFSNCSGGWRRRACSIRPASGRCRFCRGASALSPARRARRFTIFCRSPRGGAAACRFSSFRPACRVRVPWPKSSAAFSLLIGCARRSTCSWSAAAAAASKTCGASTKKRWCGRSLPRACPSSPPSGTRSM